MSLTDDINEKIKQKEASLDGIADEIVVTDTKKEEYDGAIPEKSLFELKFIPF